MTILSGPLLLGTSITDRCNLECIHCLSSSSKISGVDVPVDYIYDLIKDAQKHRVGYFEFSGGEPFLHDRFDDLLESALSHQLRPIVFTNGTLISDKWLSKFKGQIFLLKVSLDSHDATAHDAARNCTGAFVESVKNIKKARAQGYPITIQHMVTTANYKYLKEFVNFLLELGVQAVHCHYILPIGRARSSSNMVLSSADAREFIELHEKIRDELYKSGKRFTMLKEIPQFAITDPEIKDRDLEGNTNCGAAFTEMFVQSNGYAVPCAYFPSDNASLKIDSLNTRKHSLGDIYQRAEVFIRTRDLHNTGSKCEACSKISKCGSGCKAAIFALNDGLNGVDPFCWL